MLGSILSIATSGLRTSQELINTVSRNVANASTPGYSRKSQNSEPNVWTGGALSGDITRAVNESLTRRVLSTNTDLSRLKAELAPLEQLDSLVGDPQGGLSLSTKLTDLGNAFLNYAGDPIHSVTRDDVILAAQRLVNTFSDLDGRLRAMSQETVETLQIDVDRVNELTERLAVLNRQISSAVGARQDATDLQDEQDRIIAELSTYMSVNFYRNNDGAVTVMTGDYRVLVDNEARTLHAVATGTSIRVQIDSNDPTHTSAIVNNLGGRLGGHVNVADVIIPEKLAQLDAIADTLALEFQNIYSAAVMGAPPAEIGLFTDGTATYTGGAAKSGFAGRIAINPTIAAQPDWLRGDPATTAAGDNTLLVAARDLMISDSLSFTGSGLPTTSSFETASGAFQGMLARDVKYRNEEIEGNTLVYQQLSKTLADDTGVNMDDEMSRLILLQNSYSANARMITVVNQMYDDLFRAVG